MAAFVSLPTPVSARSVLLVAAVGLAALTAVPPAHAGTGTPGDRPPTAVPALGAGPSRGMTPDIPSAAAQTISGRRGSPGADDEQAWQPPAGLAGTDPHWLPPIDPALVTVPFDPPERPWMSGHRGVDLLARPEAPVHAAGTGRVTFAAPLAGRGVVVVDHGWVRTTYEPVTAQVRVGQAVTVGTVIGRVAPGTGHCGSGACLHLGLRQGGDYLNPALLWRGHAELIPW